MSDNINHPAHYNKNSIECIDVIVAAIGVEGAQNFCIGNALKYIYRHEHKGNATEDIEKAVWYLNTWLSMQHRKENKSPNIIPDGLGGYTTASECQSAILHEPQKPIECPKCHHIPRLTPSMLCGGKYYYICDCPTTIRQLTTLEATDEQEAAERWNTWIQTINAVSRETIGCPFDESENVFEYVPDNINMKDQSKETNNADN